MFIFFNCIFFSLGTMDAEKSALAADVEFGVEMDKKDKQVQPMPLKTVLSVNTLLMYTFIRAGEPVSEPEPGVFGSLEPEPLGKKVKSRSR